MYEVAQDLWRLLPAEPRQGDTPRGPVEHVERLLETCSNSIQPTRKSRDIIKKQRKLVEKL